jgi:electron transfer flavoprotein alpha subunit
MNILAIAEQRDGKIKKQGCEVIRAARTIADKTGGKVTAVVIGKGIGEAAAAAGGYGAHAVLAVDDAKLEQYAPGAYASVVAAAVRKTGATAVFIAATAQGKDYAPRAAVRLQAGFVADCVALSVEGDALRCTRPVYAGKAFTDVRVTSPVGVYTLRPNVFTAGEPGEAAPVEQFSVTFGDSDFASVVREVRTSSGKLDVSEADIVVSGGRGLKGPENFAMIEKLAGTLGAAVGASRAVVDAGWRPHDEQVGQTGKTVSPTLYIAVAISGAIQHLAGMSSSKYIVAINKDKDAPIFQIADYGIVGDAFEVVPALNDELAKALGKG